MKILLFSPFYDPHIGGLENYAKELNQNLSQEEIDIIVFTSRIPKEALEIENKDNIKIVRFPAFEIVHNYPLPKFWMPSFWKLFFGLFKEKEISLILSYTRFFNTSLIALFFSKIRKIKWIHIEHGSDFSKLNTPIIKYFPRIYDYSLGKLVLKNANKNIAVSRATAKFVKKLSDVDSLVIHRGFDKSKFDSIQPNKEVADRYENKFIITFIGRLIEGKGVIDLIKAVEKINSDNIICLIIGGGSQADVLKNYIEKNNLENKIFLLGARPFEEAISILKASDIFVNPSYTEGLPTSVIEAGFCKKGIIATNVGGTNEIMNGNNDGFLIAPGDIEELKDKIDFFMQNPEKIQEFGENAYHEVNSKFNWEKQIQEFIKIFKENANRK